MIAEELLAMEYLPSDALRKIILSIKPYVPQKVGRYIGAGAFGVVYKFQTNKVIKFEAASLNTALEYLALLAYLQNQNPQHIVRIYDAGIIKVPLKILPYQWQYIGEPIYVIYTVMEQLKKTPSVYCESIERIWFRPPALADKFLSLVHEMARYEMFYEDFHAQNIMMDGAGNLKLIDLSGFDITRRKHENT